MRASPVAEVRFVGEAELRPALDLVQEGVALVDGRGAIVFANRRLVRMVDCARGELGGTPFIALFAPAVRGRVASRLASCLPCCPSTGPVQLSAPHERRTFDLSLHRPPLAGRGDLVYATLSPAPAPSAIDGIAQELQRVSRQVLTIQESERERIAADLHDGLGQSLSAVRFGLQSISSSLANGVPDEARATVECLQRVVKETLEDVRRMAMNLRPSTLDDLGVRATLSWFLREFQALYRSIEVRSEIALEEPAVGPEVKVAMFRVVQEAMNNVAKHSRAKCVRVTLARADAVILLRVDDDGAGFDTAAVAARRGIDKRHGHTCARERVQATGGTFVVESAPGKGTHVKVSWPVSEATAANRANRKRPERDHGEQLAHIAGGGPHPPSHGVAGPPDAGP